jgi:hypothetical protein
MMGPRSHSPWRAAMALALGALTAACAAGRAGGEGSGSARTAGAGADRGGAPEARGARYFQVIPEEAYWVTHDETKDRVVVAGARLELTPQGELLRSAWESEEATRGDALVGALAVAPHLGGGYVYWTNTKAFWSAEFTGALETVAIPRAPFGVEPVIRGARNGLRGVFLITESGPLEIGMRGAGATTARVDVARVADLAAAAASEAALSDFAAVSASRALRLDVFGRASFTTDGGKSWIDATPFAGISARAVAVGPNELWLDTWAGRIAVGEGGKLGEPDMNFRGMDYAKPFQVYFPGTRATEREGVPWVFRDTSALQSALYAGVTLPDGSALAVAHSGVARVDLATGKTRAMTTDWIPQGLECLPVRVDDGALFACIWESYQGYGGYALRSSAGEPPIVEKVFSADGYFVSDDHGAVAYVGSCEAKPRLPDPEGRGRDYGDIVPEPVICVRRGPGDWAELRVDLEPTDSLLGWIPKKDGTAVAMVLGVEPDQLPEPLQRKTRWTSQGGVQVLRLYQEIDGFRWTRPSWRPYALGRGAPSMFIDKRFRVRDGGSNRPIIEGWIAQAEQYDMSERTKAGVTIGADGRPTLHPLPPRPSAVAATGDFGVTISQEGELFETVDHGRTWRPSGRSPVGPGQTSGSCSRLGCVLSSVVRVGWGASRVETSMSDERPDQKSGQAKTAPLPLPSLVCDPVGAPRTLPGGFPSSVPSRGDGARSSVPTGYGEVLEIIRESEPQEDPNANAGQGGPSGFGPGGPSPSPTAAPIAPPPPSTNPNTAVGTKKGGARGGATPATLRTHSLVYRPPLDPDAPIKRLNATNAAFGYRRPPAIPLLGASGEVALLLFPDGGELLVTPSEVINLPAFDPRRYYYGDSAPLTGLWIGRDRARVLGDARRRMALEEHGPQSSPPPLYVAVDREQLRKRALILGRRDDGATAILVLDGAAPETVGAVSIDRGGTTLSPVVKLAPWSTLTPASDPRCKADKDAWSALVLLEPRSFFALDPRALPGVSLSYQGIALVRWGRERVCAQALDLSVTDTRRRADAGNSALVIRWTGAPKAALRWQDVRQDLRCSLAPSLASPSAPAAPAEVRSPR